MSILIDKQTRLLVQGITGRQAQLNTVYMREYGTRVVAGVTPGKGGMRVDEQIPVYDTVKEALREHPEINASVLYVPPIQVRDAALEAMDAGIPFLVITAERCPHQDAMEMIAYARKKGTRILGPNSIGIISPEECVIGLIGARISTAKFCFRKGRVGVISRSGGQASTVSYYLTREGIGQTTVAGLGGDPFVGMSFKDFLELFEKDEETAAVAAFGEVGTYAEEEAADFIKSRGFTKPFFCYVAGRYVREGVRYGHSGALIAKGFGGASSKMKKLKESGAVVLEHLDDVARELKRVFQSNGLETVPSR